MATRSTSVSGDRTPRTKARPESTRDSTAGISDGARVKEKRLERGWSVRHLSANSGLAISTISKIENNKMVPTVDLFARLLAALQTTPGDWFFDTAKAAREGKPFVNVIRAADQLAVEHPSVRREVLLGGTQHQDILITRQLFPAEADQADKNLIGHVGNEMVYVIRGSLEMSFRGRKKVVLSPGDSLHFSSALPHLYQAHGGEECEIIMVWRKKD